ncbi:MAG: hypothetical protein H0V77_01435 [Actinobacteria bacterium]|nr:hypothetical protein [Actinomycetota bacterium]MDQ3218410.1 hypothetical protein [Actinomycetota bacterium]
MSFVPRASAVLLATLFLAGACTPEPQGSRDEGSSAAEPAGSREEPTEDPTKTPVPQEPEPKKEEPEKDKPAGPELPRGGRTLFPDYRVVAYYGTPSTDVLGVLGEQGPKKTSARLLEQSSPYKVEGRPVLPAFELIATVAAAAPGPDGDYNLSLDHASISRYLAAVRKIKGLLILDVQPGTNTFLEEVKPYERFLKEPDVGLALDSEWRWGAGETPAETTGHTTAAEINEVSAWLAELSKKHHLPQKLLAVHAFATGMVRERYRIKAHPRLAFTFHIDGFGGRAAKLSKYDVLKTERKGFYNGFKLFYDEDINMFSPAEVLGIKPRPDLITYQ